MASIRIIVLTPLPPSPSTSHRSTRARSTLPSSMPTPRARMRCHARHTHVPTIPRVLSMPRRRCGAACLSFWSIAPSLRSGIPLCSGRSNALCCARIATSNDGYRSGQRWWASTRSTVAHCRLAQCRGSGRVRGGGGGQRGYVNSTPVGGRGKMAIAPKNNDPTKTNPKTNCS